MTKQFVLFDGRAKNGNCDRAAVLIMSDTEDQARLDALLYENDDCVWYEFDTKGSTLINPVMRMDLPPNNVLEEGTSEEKG